MLDIETLGNRDDSIVVSIGAVFFDPNTGETGAEFERVLAYQDQIDKGRKPTQSTMQFWFSQEKEPQKIFLEDGISTDQALQEFEGFICDNAKIDQVKPWGNGPSFDLTIMESLFRDFGFQIPWCFWNVRCLRTFKEYIYNGKDLKREGVYHDAKDDCKHQIKVIHKGLNKE